MRERGGETGQIIEHSSKFPSARNKYFALRRDTQILNNMEDFFFFWSSKIKDMMQFCPNITRESAKDHKRSYFSHIFTHINPD